MTAYSKTRLTGFRVPYVVEAWPENGMAQLSAESALYCRIFTEGLLGLEPIGFDTFSLKPNLPSDWNFLEIKNIHAFNCLLDIRLKREHDKVRLIVVKNGKTLFSKIIKNATQASIHIN